MKHLTQKKGAACSKCNKRWLWDWRQDSYRDLNGKFCKEKNGNLFCTCNNLLAKIDDDGEVTNKDKNFKKIDWDDEKNSFE